MVTKEDLEKRYSNLSNAELLDIIENKFSYTELAVTVAIEEIGNRKVTEEEIKLFEGALRRRQLRLILGGKMKPNDAAELKALFTEE